MKVTKTGFDGGRIAPNLEWSPDLQLHANACKEILNWIPGVDRSISRRPGGRVLIQAEDKYPIIPGFKAQHFDFQYGVLDYDTVVIHTDSEGLGSADDDTPTVISVFNKFGNRVATFESPDTPWTNGDIDSITFVQSFDVLLIFANKPTQRLARFAETTWTLESHTYKGGPWKPGNEDDTVPVKAEIDFYDATQDYNIDDIVITGSQLNLQGTSSLTPAPSYRVGNDIIFTAYTRIETTVASPPVEVGEKVLIQGAVVGAYGDLNGLWTVAAVGNGSLQWVDLETKTKWRQGDTPAEFINNYDGNNMAAATLSILGEHQRFHVCIQAHTSASPQDPTAQPSDYWTEDSFLYTELTLKSTQDVWTANDVGRAFRVVSDVEPRIFGNFLSTDEGATSIAVPAQGQVTLTTDGGVWAGEIALQLSLDNGRSWEDIALITSIDGERNATVSRTITDFGGIVRALMRERTAATGTDTGCKYSIQISDPQYHYFNIVEFISTTEVRVAPQNPMSSIPDSWRWNFSAFGSTEGYPQNAVVLDDTLIISGVPGSPGFIYFSNITDWTNWISGSYAGAAFEVAVGKDTRNVVQWMRAKESLLIGTDAGEWALVPRNPDLVLSLTNYELTRQAEYGSANVPAIVAGDVVVYVERSSFRLRAMENSIYDRKTFQSADITINVPDWFESDSVIQMAYSRSPVPVLWVLTDTSRLYSWTFDNANNRSAWAEHRFAGVSTVYSISTTVESKGDALLATVDLGGRLAVLSVSKENDCMDILQEYATVDADTYYYYPGKEDNPVVYDSAFIQNPSAVFVKDGSAAHNAPRFYRSLGATPFPDTISFDGVVGVEDEDYIRIAGSHSTMALLLAPGSVTATSGGSPLSIGIDYDIGLGTTCCYVELTENLPAGMDWSDLTIRKTVPPAGDLVDGINYTVQNNNNTVIIIGFTPDQIEIRETISGTIYTQGFEYQAYEPTQGFAMLGFPNATRAELVKVGYPYENLIHPTDFLANFQLGGPGGTVQSKEFCVLVRDSLGLQVRQHKGWLEEEEEDGWTTIPDRTPTAILGETLPLYTGVQRIDFSTDIQYNGVDIQVRAIGIRKSTIGSMAIDVKRIE